MPDKARFEPQDVISNQDYVVKENKDRSNAQANDTFVLNAKDNRSIGANGETLAFGKKQFSHDQAVEDARMDNSTNAQMRVMELKADKEVKAWAAQKDYLDNIDADLKYAKVAKDVAIEDLNKGRANNLPENELETLEAEVARQTARVDKMEADKENLPQLKGELTQQLAGSQKLQEYVRATQAAEGAKNMVNSSKMIADSSSNLYQNRDEMGTDPSIGGDRDLITRSVASAKVDQLLGINVCAQEKFGVDDQGQLIGVSVQADGAGVRSEHGENEWMEKQTAFLAADYADPNIQKGLYDLEALDYVTGQIDRHQGNIFVDGNSGKVTGIDNDLAFPQIDREEMLERNQGLKDKAVSGMPKMMHEETAAKIMSVTPDQLRETLKGVVPPDGSKGLDDAEIEGAVQRLEELQKAIEDAPNGGIKVVPEFTRETYEESIATQKANNAQQDLTRDPNSTKAVKYDSTSYIGAIENEREFAQAKIDANDNLYVMRDATAVSKAKINPEYEAYKQLPAGEKAKYDAIQKEVESIEDKMAENQAKIDKLKKTEVNFKNNAANLRHGGVEGAIKHYEKENAELEKKRNTKIEQTKTITAPVVADNALKAQQAALAKQNAAPPQQNAAGPAVAQSGWAQPQVSANQNPQRVAAAGGHRAAVQADWARIGPSNANPQTVPPAGNHRAAQVQNAGGPPLQADPAPTPAPQVNVAGDGSPAIDAQGVKDPAKSLQRQHSVRDDMLNKGTVKNNPFMQQDLELQAAEKEKEKAALEKTVEEKQDTEQEGVKKPAEKPHALREDFKRGTPPPGQNVHSIPL